MRIEDALMQVRAIRLQVARTEQFCCYRWATVATSGILGLIAAVGQPNWVADPARQSLRYVTWWVLVAAVSVAIVGAEIFWRWLRSDSAFARKQTALALEQFAPCVLAGALVTASIEAFCPEHAPMYPAIWSVLFAMGIIASRRHLPPGGVWLAVYYLVSGLFCIAWGRGDQALQPWTMALTFGIGQLMAAIVLRRQQEPADGNS